MADGAAESTKELTEEGAKVTTVAEGTDATAAPPAEPANPLAEPIFISVVHTFVDDEKKAAWWAKMGPLMGDKEQMAAMAASWKALGYVGHYSMPCGPEGAKINCLWECQTEDAASKFQARRPRRNNSPHRYAIDARHLLDGVRLTLVSHRTSSTTTPSARRAAAC